MGTGYGNGRVRVMHQMYLQRNETRKMLFATPCRLYYCQTITINHIVNEDKRNYYSCIIEVASKGTTAAGTS
jgi:hypothetical protein